ncbi:dihydrodipicolinate synthase family protein [Methylovirgula sp. 4M-Z18]|uniref:dihydrodipicolinate synthase family protein n=1 Tax=Methylovirgula sp. 4M-Z18 TaxID=2293567 RepID=UPI000E2EA351|nr:dihydrodipicolinate synthase family protein [Methylovirgula sp. 4M-Z18]RFB78325.1 dihydrodipicolinate synthase family protein [Methylovirgula sp. 4M-Z18]
MSTLLLPTATGLEPYRLGPASPYARRAQGPFPRIAYAAAHVVADPRRAENPWQAAAVDWDATLAFRHHLWGLGFKIAEAMDTSQRGMGLDWPGAKELIARSLREAKTVEGADLACGAGTDQLAPQDAKDLNDVIRAYEEQMQHIEAHGGRMILMASRALCAHAKSPDDYLKVYGRLIDQARDKVILHWLGDMFDPHLTGYWGSTNVDEAMATCLDLINARRHKIDGIKISLLKQAHEETMRARLPDGVKMFTGDDFNYADLIAGDGVHHSHALLGIFDPIAPAAAAAFARLAAGDRAGYDAILAPTVPLSRKIFEAPTQFYKAGVVFLAWLNGFQTHFAMLGGMQSARGILHYADVFRLADQAGLLIEPELAAERMKAWCAVHGVA